MGFLDSLFKPGDIEEQGQIKSQTNFPQWYNRLNQANLLRATEAAFEPYEKYQGPRQALSGKNQRDARQGISDISGIAAPSFAEAMNQSRLGATQLAGTDMRPYMSPYQQGVTDIALREARKQGDIQRNQLNSQATLSGAFGGSRAALEQMESERNIQQNLGDIQATGSQRAFESAIAQLMGDRAAASQAAPQMAALGTGLQGVLTSGLKESELSGERERAERQGALDIAYQDYLTQRAYPMAQASGLQALLQGSQVPGSSLQTTFGQPPSVAGQIGGLGLSTLGLLGSTGAFGPAGYLGIFAEGGEVGYQDGSPGGVGTRSDILAEYLAEIFPAGSPGGVGTRSDILSANDEYLAEYFPALRDREERRPIAEDTQKILDWIDTQAETKVGDPENILTQIWEGLTPPTPSWIAEEIAATQAKADRIDALGRSLEQRFPPAPEVTPEVTPELTAPEPDLQEDLVSEESRGLDITYNDLLTAGLGMMSAASQPGASAFGSLGAGGLSALQAKKEEEARRLEEELDRRKLELTERELDILEDRYGDEYLADMAKIDADIQAGNIQAVLDRYSDITSTLADINPIENPELYKELLTEYYRIKAGLGGMSLSGLVSSE